MTDNHTPGPWSFHAEDLRGGRYWTVCRSQDFDSENIDIHESDNGEADARLIAAAPELAEWGAELMALLDDYMVVTSLTANSRYRVAVEAFRAALAKATQP